ASPNRPKPGPYAQFDSTAKQGTASGSSTRGPYLMIERVSGNPWWRQPRKAREIGPDLWHGESVPDIAHRISVADAKAHLLDVVTTVRAGPDQGPLPSPLVLFMPVWTPGSYLVREYARHVEGFAAFVDGQPASHRKVRKNAWQVTHDGARSVEIRYRVYANELTVRTNHV